MKFTKGRFVLRDGVSFCHTGQVRESRVTCEGLYLYTVPYVTGGRAVGGPMIEFLISSPRKDIIRTEAWHFSGCDRNYPEFELNCDGVSPEIEETPERIVFKSGRTKLVITRRPCSFTYYYDDRRLTGTGNSDGRAMISYIHVRDEDMMNKQLDLELIGSSGNASKTDSYMCVQLDTDIGEKIYGLGERFTPFIRNGQSVTTWNEDGGADTDIAYKCIPFYISNRNYGVFVNDPGPVSYEICSEHTARVQLSVPGEKIDFMVIGGGSMKDVICSYTSLTGKPALPPAWSFGLWMTTSSTMQYDENTVMELVDGMRDRGIPLHVFMYDAFATKENQWVSFQWDRDIFPHIEEQLKTLREERHIKTSYWLNSYIAQRSPLFNEAKKLGYLIKKKNGDVWQTDLWQAGMGIVDFTNPDAYRWFQDKLRPLIEQGIDCIKTDFGERIPTDVVFSDGSDPLRMHNYYTYLYNRCVYELLAECWGENNACLFARSATAGCQQFPVHWSGDPEASYTEMALSLRAGLSLSLSGFSFWSHDIAGYGGKATADLYKRWAAFGLLSTHSRLHGTVYKVPWLFSKEGEENGEESAAVLKAFTELKCSLMPYLYSAAVVSHRTGIPSMRPMVLEFGSDICCEDLDRQYMLGDSLLVAPVFRESGNVDYYLPTGEWTHLLSGETKQGGGWMNDTYDYFSLPLFVRENSIIPVGSSRQEVDYDYTCGTTLNIFALKTGAECEVYDASGEFAFSAEAVNDNGNVTVTVSGRFSDLKICMRNIHTVSDLNGADCEDSPEGIMMKVRDRVITFSI